MGRRKIEIKAIKDDRNRSVTFLKRKGGLFKKAHELSVLCSVEVAVIIFGTNKKLYEYSSHDIHETINRYQYYGGPHEHKGPQDYANKQGGGDDDEDEDGDEGNGDDQGQPQQHPQHQGPPQMPNQPIYPPHMRQGPSASPPVGNGNMQYRRTTPQPPMNLGSRPASRNDIIRQGTPHMPQQHHTPPMHTPPMPGPGHPQNGFTHPQMPSQVYGMNAQQPMYQQPPQPPQHPHTAGFAPPGFTQFQQPHPQMQQQMYPQGQPRPQPGQQQPPGQPPHPPQPPPGQRRPSMPPNFQEPHQRPQSHPQVQIQAPPPPPNAPPPQQQQNQQEEQANEGGLQPHHPKPMKSHSVYTPIEASRSVLGPIWGFGASPIDKQDTPVKTSPDDRAKSAEPASSSRPTDPLPPPKPEPPFQPSQRTQSTTSLGGGGGGGADASKRPRLKVHIPSEPSEDGVSAGSGPGSTSKAQDNSSQSTPGKNKDQPAGSGVVLPPPSPSASAILSAGATGPPNPFARPLPPTSAGGPSQSNSTAFSGNQGAFGDQTPISALPSRFAGQLLPSPSQFFADWNFSTRNGDESAILPSPLNFQTPVNLHGPGLGTSTGKDESEDAKKRKLDEESRDQGGEKKVKT